MTKNEFQRIQQIKQVLNYTSRGRGLAASIVDVFRGSKDTEERAVARKILLGFPSEMAVAEILDKRDVLHYLVREARVNSREASRSAERLSSLYERWFQQRARRITEGRVMAMRGHIISAVLGAVVALLSALAPIIASFQFTYDFAPTPPSSVLPYLGIAFSLVSSFFLGLQNSPDKPYVDPIISSASYLVTMTMVAPITSITLGPLWVVI